MGLGVIVRSKLKSFRDVGVAKASLNRAIVVAGNGPETEVILP